MTTNDRLYYVYCKRCGNVVAEYCDQATAGKIAWRMLSRVIHCSQCKHAWQWQCAVERPVPHPTPKADPVPQC